MKEKVANGGFSRFCSDVPELLPRVLLVVAPTGRRSCGSQLCLSRLKQTASARTTEIQPPVQRLHRADQCRGQLCAEAEAFFWYSNIRFGPKGVENQTRVVS